MSVKDGLAGTAVRETNEQVFQGGSCALSTFFFFFLANVSVGKRVALGCDGMQKRRQRGGEVEGGSTKGNTSRVGRRTGQNGESDR